MRGPAERAAYMHSSSFLLYRSLHPSPLFTLLPPRCPSVGVKYITCLLIKPPLQVWRGWSKRLESPSSLLFLLTSLCPPLTFLLLHHHPQNCLYYWAESVSPTEHAGDILVTGKQVMPESLQKLEWRWVECIPPLRPSSALCNSEF